MSNQRTDDAVLGSNASGGDDVPSTSNGDAGSLFAPSVRDFPWPKAALAGAVAFLVEYVVVAAIVVLHPRVSTGAETTIESLKSFGIILFNTHNVPTVIVERGVNYPYATRFNQVTGATDPTIPAVVYLAIPVVALLLAGVIFEYVRPDGDEDLLEGSALVGVGLVAGYVVVGVIGSFAVATTTYFDPGSVTEGVDQLFAFVATVAYPLLFGTVGAFCLRAYDAYGPRAAD